jgi:hypothetical protein
MLILPTKLLGTLFFLNRKMWKRPKQASHTERGYFHELCENIVKMYKNIRAKR